MAREIDGCPAECERVFREPLNIGPGLDAGAGAARLRAAIDADHEELLQSMAVPVWKAGLRRRWPEVLDLAAEVLHEAVREALAQSSRFDVWQKMELPPNEFSVALENEEKRQAGNPVFKALFPAFGRMRWLQARADVRRALLFAANDVQLHGPQALKNHPDPAAGGSFEYAAFPHGFEMRSKLNLDEPIRSELRVAKLDTMPMTLVVGRRGK
jgi:hypothetical protein